MSTTIYNGYQLPLLNVAELNSLILSFQKLVEKRNETRVAKLIGERFIELFDDAATLPENVFQKRYFKGETKEKMGSVRIVRKLYQDIKEDYFDMKKTMERNNEVDVDTCISVFPLEDKLLLLVFSEDSETLDLLESMEGVSYYGYWNNTDPDEQCSEEEWEMRKRDWEIALPGIGIPKENGMTIQITEGLPNFSNLRTANIHQYLPTFETRRTRIAKEIVTEQIFQKFKEEFPEKNAMRLAMESSKQVNSLENDASIQKEKESLRNCLIEEVGDVFGWTFNDLFQTKENQLLKP